MTIGYGKSDAGIPAVPLYPRPSRPDETDSTRRAGSRLERAVLLRGLQRLCHVIRNSVATCGPVEAGTPHQMRFSVTVVSLTEGANWADPKKVVKKMVAAGAI